MKLSVIFNAALVSWLIHTMWITDDPATFCACFFLAAVVITAYPGHILENSA